MSLSRSCKGSLISQGPYLEGDIAIILGTLGARIIIAVLQYCTRFYYLNDSVSVEELSADCCPSEIWNIFPRSENMLVLRTSNFQGATIRPIVPTLQLWHELFSGSVVRGKLLAAKNRWCPRTNVRVYFHPKWRLLYLLSFKSFSQREQFWKLANI